MLEDEGYKVRSAKNGRDGYSTYLLFNPDLVLTDIQWYDVFIIRDADNGSSHKIRISKKVTPIQN